MSLDKLFDDPELCELIARVEEAYGLDAVSEAFTNAYAAVVRVQRTQMKAGEVPDADSSPALRAAFRRELEALMREH